MRVSKANNERVKAIMSYVDVPRNNLLTMEKKRVRLKEHFSKRELKIPQSQIINLKEDVAFIKQKVRRLNIRY